MILRDLPDEPWSIAEWLRKRPIPGVRDVSASYETIGIYFEPGAQIIDSITRQIESWSPPSAPVPKRHRIPVCYEMGEDIAEAAQSLNLSVEDVATLHVSQEYRCFAVGFCPGFGYLGWLPERLSGVPRRPSPRVRVEPGSIGITGRQTAAYPLSTPGGWSLIGRSPLILVDVEDSFFPISAGDRVQFFAIDEAEFRRLEGERL